MATVARPASSDAAPYLQTADIRDETPNPMGRPAYQKAGIKRVPLLKISLSPVLAATLAEQGVAWGPAVPPGQGLE